MRTPPGPPPVAAAPQDPVTPVTRNPTEAPDGYRVTGVTGPPEATHPLSGLVTGDWLEAQTFPDVEYVVPNLIPEGFTLLVGAPKAGKSWLALAMGVSVAAGGRVLDQTVTARPVLYLALEDSHRRLRYRSKTLYPVGSIPEGLHIMNAIPAGHYAPEVVKAWLTTLPADSPPPLVIVDTLGKVRPMKRAGEGVYDYDYRIGGAMKHLADSWPGSALVAVHHDRKAGAADFVDDVSGSNGLAGSADTIVIVRRDRNGSAGTFLVTGRDVTEGAYATTFTDGHWTLSGGDFPSAASAYAQTAATMGKGDTARQIVGWLSDNGPSTPKRIAEALGLDHNNVKVTAHRLAQDGRLHRADGGHYFLPDTA